MKIVLDHLTKRFPNRNRKIREDVVAVDDFTVEIPMVGHVNSLNAAVACGVVVFEAARHRRAEN